MSTGVIDSYHVPIWRRSRAAAPRRVPHLLADQATAELVARGYEEIHPAQEFALQAILSGADNASDLGRRMSVTKQAAAKTIAALEQRNYVGREPDPADKRRMRLYVTAHGLAMLREGEEIFDKLRGQWEKQVGADALSQVETTLRQLVGNSGGPAGHARVASTGPGMRRADPARDPGLR
jgi:DNA-binding MarR family transcriptional regulator